MPGNDRTGPAGLGPATGRGLGPCGRGLARGLGFGRGYCWQNLSKEQKIKTLEAQKKVIEEELKELEA